MATLTEAQADFLRQPYYGVAATVRPDGSPQLTTVWVDSDGAHVVFNTAEGRAKPKYIRQNPQVGVYVMNPENAYQWLAVSGPAELTHDGADEHIDKLAYKYLGKETYPWRSPTEQRVIVRVTPKRVHAYGFDE